jgi:regulatory protein
MNSKGSRPESNLIDSLTVFDRYYNLSLRYLSYRPRSEKEMRDYLLEKQKRKKGLSDETISEIIKKLKSYKFIDDRQFTKSWIESRIKLKNKPVRVIEYELKQKGISGDLIDEFLTKNEIKEN